MRDLTPHSTLESLRKEAQAWLRALRAGDAAARARLLAVMPESPADPGLRPVQLALAREHGLAGWAALKEALDDLAMARRSEAELAGQMLHSAKPWDSDKHGGARIFRRMPQLSRHSIHTAALCGDLAEVKRRLALDPARAKQSGGPLDWQPLQYLAYGRLPGAETHAVEIARLLLEAGADPNVDFDDGWGNPFTLLNGIIGRGEQDRTEHPRAEELARLFLDAGKAAFDTQVNYDTSLGPDDTRWLELLWSRSEPAKWHDRIYARGKASTLDYLLGNAGDRNHPLRAAWLLAHGADPNAVHGYSLKPVVLHAQLFGPPEILALLLAHGARAQKLSGEQAFMAACTSGDLAEARRLAAAYPAVLRNPEMLLWAAQRDLDDVAALLLDLGMPVDLCPHDRKRALHWCGQCGTVRIAERLIAAGSDIDARGGPYKGTPLGFAIYFRQQPMIDLLAPLSRDVCNLTNAGKLDRLAQLLSENPSLVDMRDPNGATALFCLPDDEEVAAQAADLLLGLGADPRATDKEGDTPAQAARKRGLEDAADIIEAALDVRL